MDDIPQGRAHGPGQGLSLCSETRSLFAFWAGHTLSSARPLAPENIAFLVFFFGFF